MQVQLGKTQGMKVTQNSYLFFIVLSSYAIEDMGAVQVEVSPTTTGKGDPKTRRLRMPLTWFGVFDGHGGEKASQFCADWLSSYVRNEDSFPYDLGYSMKNAFTAIDEDFITTGNLLKCASK